MSEKIIANRLGPFKKTDDLLTIKNEWDEVFSHCYSSTPFFSFEYMYIWYSCFAAPDQIIIYRVNNEEYTIGFLPLFLDKKKYFRILTGLTNDHSFHPGPVVRKGFETMFEKCMLETLLRDQNLWDLFYYKHSYSFAQLAGLFSKQLLQNTNVVWNQHTSPTYSAFLNKAFDDYIKDDLSKKVRKNFLQSKNRIAKQGAYHLMHYAGDKAIELWPKFLELENSGWKGQAESSIMKISDNYKKYYKDLLILLAKHNALNMYFLYLNDTAIAAGFGYIIDDTYHYAKAGYEENLEFISPSNLLLLLIVEHLIKNFPSVKRFHMFPGDFGYKHRYNNEDVSHIETILYSNTLRGKILQVKRSLKNLLCRPTGYAACRRIW